MSRLEVALFILLMLIGAALRVAGLTAMPPGFNDDELTALRITDQVRAGQITVLYDVGDPAGGREGLYYPLLSVFSGLVGGGLMGYRLLGVLLNLATLGLTYGIARHMWWQPQRGGRLPVAALAALAAMAVGFWPVFTSRMVAREALLPFFGAAAAYCFVRGLSARSPAARDQRASLFMVAGAAFMGLSLYVHWTAIAFVIGFFVFGAYLNLRYRRLARRGWGDVGFALLVALIIAVPFSVSLLRNPGVSPLHYYLSHIADALPESLFNTAAGLFWQGDANPTHNLPGQPLLGPFSAALLVVGIAAAVRRYRRPAYAVILIALLVALLPDALSQGGPNFRRLAVAMPALYITVGVGADAALGRIRRRPELVRPVVLAAVALFVAGAALTAHNLSTVWSLRDDVFSLYHANLGRLAAHADATARDIPTVLCSPSLMRTDAQQHLSDREMLGYMLHQTDLPVRYADCRSSLVLTHGGARGQILFTYANGPALVPEALAAWLSDARELRIGGLPAGSAIEVEVVQELGDAVGRFITTAPAGYPPEAPGGPGPATLPVRMGGNLTFAGYTVGDSTVHPGESVEVVTYWRVDGPTPKGLQMFTHVLFDPSGLPVGQIDLLGPLVETLKPSDFFVQLHYIPLREQMVFGKYDISVGMYMRDGERLAVYDGENARGDRLFLQQIEVTRPDADD